MKNWRSSVAAVLSGVFLLLTISAELMHQHPGLPSGVPKMAAAAPGQPASGSSNHQCVACVFSVTHVAFVLTTLFIPHQQSTLLSALREQQLPAFALTLFHTLRAPPAVLA